MAFGRHVDQFELAHGQHASELVRVVFVGLEVARSDAAFLDFIKRDSYIACPLNGEESIWNPLTGLPFGTLAESPVSIALISFPMDSTQPFEPLSVTKDELRVLAAKGKKSFFIRSDGKYGPVTLFNGVVAFAVP